MAPLTGYQYTGILLHMIKTIITQCIGWIVCLASLVMSSTASAQTIRYGIVTPPNHMWSQVMQQFKTNLENTSKQSIVVKESRFAKVRGESHIVDVLRKGQLQIGIVAAGALTTLDPSLNGWLVPYQFTETNQMGKAADGDEAKAMLAELEAYDLMALGYTFAGMRQILTPFPVASISGLKGKRIRSYTNDVFYNWYRQLGIDPQPVQIQDVLVKLEKGELDAVDCDLATAVGLKLYESAPHLMLTNHMAFPGIFMVSRKWWSGLTPAVQEQVTLAFSQATRWGFKRLEQTERDNLKILREQGVTVTEFDEADFAGVPEKLREFYYTTNPRLQKFGAAIE